MKMISALIGAGVATALLGSATAGAELPDSPGVMEDGGMIVVPAGEFVMGSNKTDTTNSVGEFGNTKPWYLDEHPEHKLKLAAFYIDKFEVTNAEYRDFVAAVNVTPPEHWIKQGFILSMNKAKLRKADVDTLRKVAVKVFKLDMDTRTMTKDQLLAAIDKHLDYQGTLPVTFVSWHDADAYCKWAGKRLPTEQEWEKAARGSNGNEFPWGNQWRAGMGNTGEESWDDGVAPVGSYKTDKSSFGVYDMSGNVSEWVSDWYQAYPGSDYTSKDFGETFKVVRGPGWGGVGHYALQLFQRGAYRFNLPPQSRFDDLGFRCAVTHAPPAKIPARADTSH